MFSMKSNKKEEPVMTTFHNENENQKKNFSIFMCQVLYECMQICLMLVLSLNQIIEAKRWTLIKAYDTQNEHEVRGSTIQINTHHLKVCCFAFFYIEKDWSLNHNYSKSINFKIKITH